MKLLSFPLLLVALGAVGYAQNNIVAGNGWIAGSNISQNGNTYDQVVLDGTSVSVQADPGQIVRVSFIDPSDDIVQVELSGSGTLMVTMNNTPTIQTGITQPTGYLQNLTGTPGYTKGLPVIIVTGASSDTYLSIFSVGPANGNPALFDATHQGGQTTGIYKGHVADIAFVSISGSSINSILAGNAQIELVNARSTNVINRLVFHGQADYGARISFVISGVTYQYDGYIGIGSGSTLSQDSGKVLVAGGNLRPTVCVENVSLLKSQAGTDSAGNTQTAQTITSSFVNPDGTSHAVTVSY